MNPALREAVVSGLGIRLMMLVYSSICHPHVAAGDFVVSLKQVLCHSFTSICQFATEMRLAGRSGSRPASNTEILCAPIQGPLAEGKPTTPAYGGLSQNGHERRQKMKKVKKTIGKKENEKGKQTF